MAWPTCARLASGCAPQPEEGIVLITDPGPDPDDVKALLILGVLHRQRKIRLHAIVTNGGQQADLRARLALCIMDWIGVRDVPIGVGSAGKAYVAEAHEYAISGFDTADISRLMQGPKLLSSVLHAAGERSLTFVAISSMRDLADLMAVEPELFLARTREVAVMGGLTYDAARSTWLPDT